MSEIQIQGPRDRDGSFGYTVIKKRESTTDEIENFIFYMFAKVMRISGIEEKIHE